MILRYTLQCYCILDLDVSIYILVLWGLTIARQTVPRKGALLSYDHVDRYRLLIHLDLSESQRSWRLVLFHYYEVMLRLLYALTLNILSPFTFLSIPMNGYPLNPSLAEALQILTSRYNTPFLIVNMRGRTSPLGLTFRLNIRFFSFNSVY